MWRNYLIVGLRSLMKSRTYAAINILGLAIGMAACLIILIFVRNELTYDRWMPEADRTFQLQTYYTDRTTGEQQNLQMSAYVAKAAMLKDFPQIESSVHLLSAGPVVIRNGQATEVEAMKFVDGPLFDVLDLPLVQGNPKTALAQPGGMVLTESEAKRRFGDENPMGQTLTLVSRGISQDYRVTGVLKDIPKNSHLKLNMVARYDVNAYWAENPQFLTEYGWQAGALYFRLKPGANVGDINSQFHAWEKRNIPDQIFGERRTNQGDSAEFALVNIRDIHLGRAQEGAMTPGNDRRSIMTFAVIALLILGMACVNFVNLATARASQRAREVALRKVLGANRRQLVIQFIGESILVSALAMLLALAMTELVLPLISTFLDAELSLKYVGTGGLLLPIIALVLLVGVAGGVYPAFYLSRFQPARVLKANKSAADAEGSGRLRSALVVAQFAVSIGLIICTIVVYAQTLYARNSDPGYRRDGLIQVSGMQRRQLDPIKDTLVREIGKIDGVTAVGRTAIGINTLNNTVTGVQLPGQTEPIGLGYYNVDTNFFDTMGIKLLAGRGFDINRPLDDSTRPTPEDPAAEHAFVARGANTMINATAAKRLGFKAPQDAIGKQIRAAITGDQYGLVPVTIIGVVQDSRFRSIRDPLDAIMFFYDRNNHNEMLVRYTGDPAAAMGKIEAVWKRLAPDTPFTAKFGDDIVRDLYKSEASRAQIFGAFSLLAVVVGCLGLFGLAAFTAQRRTKEIGIRKVLGASTSRIVRLLVWQFSRPVILANIIAWPIAWWVMRDWLNGFDARIALGPTPFLVAGALALLIAIGTIGAHSFRVARTNPIHALRYE
ncbi:ABC transporter permease [Sphingomonas colocasiae]|uniref:ABC transporter permease n=1 Tax=Sphingomonas colocasiae TaxID=1848973 RepID=A0ABS7PRX3_9SPHN|nr:ABC transporter permease [Sphingomonas colocasiae]MBY8824097.1 ABC transporter permease [Sphingomonas colocasiae]